MLDRKTAAYKDNVETVERLHSQYASILFDHCQRMLRDFGEAEDAVQETFLRAFRSLSTFRYGSSHLTWLYRISTNVCLGFIDKRKRRMSRVDQVNLQMENFQDVHNAYCARQTLKKVVRSLDDKGKQIIVGYYLGDMTQDEIATTVGLSRRTVVKRMARLKSAVNF